MSRLRRLLLAAAALGSLALAAAAELPDNPLDGRRLFESKRCHRCHGLAGIEPGIAFDLGEGHFDGTLLDLGASLWNHVPGMSVGFEAAGLEWPGLVESEAQELLSFLYFLDYLGHPGAAEAGRELFQERGCAECHTVGRRGLAAGPDLAVLTDHASPLYMAQAIWNHGPAMLESLALAGMPPPKFEEGDLADLAAFIRQSAPPGLRERRLVEPGNPNRGATLFRSKGCAECHGRDARGGDPGPDLTLAPLHRSADGIAGTMWNHSLEMRNMMARRGIRWPSLEIGELADLVAFLYFLPFADQPGDASRGAAVFRDRGCSECHGGGEGRAPDLTVAGERRSPAGLVAAMWSHAPIMRHSILAEGKPWPVLTGENLRDLRAYLGRPSSVAEQP